MVEKIAELASEYNLSNYDYTEVNRMVDLFGKFTASSWDRLKEIFPALNDVITETASRYLDINTFLGGLNLTEAPGFRLSIALIIPVLAGLTQWLSVKTMNTTPQDPDAPRRRDNEDDEYHHAAHVGFLLYQHFRSVSVFTGWPAALSVL